MRTVARELYPFEGRFLDLDGLRYHYLDEGAGPPVLMVHGNPTWSFYYRDLVKALRDTRRCIVPDHIGCGLSDKPGDDRYEYTLARRVADLSRLIEHLDLGDAIDVVAHDWGGMIASAWIVEHVPRVRRVVMMNTAAFRNPRGRKIPAALRLARDSSFGALLVRGFNAFSRGATRFAVTKPLPRAVRDAYAAPYDGWDARIATLRFVQDIPLDERDRAWQVIVDTEAKLSRLANTPVLLPWGMRDFVFDGRFLDRWLELLPHAEAHRFEDAGHYVLEDARERILPLIREFLDR